MRREPNVKIEKYRLETSPESMACAGTNAGAFQVGNLCIVACDLGGWDHVSVHVEGRCPIWGEMCFVKDLFFRDDEVVMQLHPAKSQYVNEHPFMLHLWRPQTTAERQKIIKQFGHDPALPDVDYPAIPLPPKDMV
jgi:hypothetical protein